MTQQPVSQGWPEEISLEDAMWNYGLGKADGYNTARQDCLIVHNRIVAEKDKKIAELEAILNNSSEVSFLQNVVEGKKILIAELKRRIAELDDALWECIEKLPQETTDADWYPDSLKTVIEKAKQVLGGKGGVR
jgi:hypothetical protein